MNLSLSLLELNNLYYATSKLVEQNESHLKEFGRNVSSVEYFTKELNNSIDLRDKIQDALYTEARKLDEAIEYVRNYERDYSQFNDYASSMSTAQYEDRMAGNL